MRAVAIWLDTLSAGLNRLAMWGAVATVATLVLVAIWQVIARYILSQPPVWTEELARYLMVWGALLGASCAFRAKADPSLFPAMRQTAGPTGKFLAIVRALAVFAFIAPILWYSVFGLNGRMVSGYIGRLMGRQAETMDVPMAVFGIAIPIAFGIILIHLLAALARHFGSIHAKETP